jgi:hypothetical protein
MKTLQRLELLKDMIQQAIDQGATSVQQIHEYIADLPFEALEKSGLLDEDKLGLREKQKRSIGMVYGAIRRINHQVGTLLSDQFGNLEDARIIARNLEAKAKKSARPKKKEKRK